MVAGIGGPLRPSFARGLVPHSGARWSALQLVFRCTRGLISHPPPGCTATVPVNGAHRARRVPSSRDPAETGPSAAPWPALLSAAALGLLRAHGPRVRVLPATSRQPVQASVALGMLGPPPGRNGGPSLRPLVDSWQGNGSVPSLGPPSCLPARHPRGLLRWLAPRACQKWTRRQRGRRSCDHSPSGGARPRAPGAEVSCPVLSCARPHACAAPSNEIAPRSVALGWVDRVGAARSRGAPACYVQEGALRVGRSVATHMSLRNWGGALGSSGGRAWGAACSPAPPFPPVPGASEPLDVPACAKPAFRLSSQRGAFGHESGARSVRGRPAGWGGVRAWPRPVVCSREQGCTGTKSFLTGRGRWSESRPWAGARRAHPVRATPAPQAPPASAQAWEGAPAPGRDVCGVS